MIDDKWVFSHEQAVTATGDTESEKFVDTGIANPNSGGASPKWINILVHTTVTGTSSTVAFSISTSPDKTTWTKILTTEAIAEADLVAGWGRSIALPPEHARYIKVVYTVGVAVLSAGKFQAYLATHPVYSRT